MGQEFQILCCFSCHTFQVDIVKKQNVKWQCKLCGEKQSVKRVFGVASSAKECREMVQDLNRQRGEKLEDSEDNEEAEEGRDPGVEAEEESKIVKKPGQASLWSKFM